jgi:exopolysaccharide biosynthesis polyprenyl glycosylphosphotransferase
MLPRQKSKSAIPKAFRGSEPQSAAGPRPLLKETEFLRLLSLERKRSERSRRPFLLMLLHGRGLFASQGGGAAGGTVATALLDSTRETDLIGWYRENEVLGAIFTELTEPAADSVKALQAKVENAVRGVAKTGGRIRIVSYLFPEVFEPSRVEARDLTLYPELQESLGRKAAQRIKRILDVAGSLLLLIALSPLLLAVALAVKLSSRGPVLFRQARVGKHGQQFQLLKFRSMYVNSDSSLHRQYVTRLIAGARDVAQMDDRGKAVFKLTRDPRITPLGRILRRCSMDELPQFLNVLRGDMSLVGPRPPLPYEVERYSSWHLRRILEAKPGITGLWQVSGRCRVGFDDMVRLDLAYSRRASFWLDLRILLKTPLAILFGDGAH